MPLRKDIKKVLVIGSGPIVIGQAAEFDYAGTQACRALKQEGLEVVLVNSNPANQGAGLVRHQAHHRDRKARQSALHARRSDRTYTLNAAR